MGYWTEVKDIVLKGLDLAMGNIKEGAGFAFENIKEGAGTAVEKGKEGVAYAQLKKDLFFEHRKLQSLLADLGDLTHDLYKAEKDIYKDEKVKNIMERVVQVEKECKRMRQDIRGLGKKD